MSWHDQIPSIFLFGLTTGIAISAATQYLLTSLIPPPLPHSQDYEYIPPSPSSPTDYASGYGMTRKPSRSFSQHGRTLQRLEQEFTVSGKRLQTMVRHMVGEMKKGLVADGHNLLMLPSFVVKRPSGGYACWASEASGFTWVGRWAGGWEAYGRSEWVYLGGRVLLNNSSIPLPSYIHRSSIVWHAPPCGSIRFECGLARFQCGLIA